MSTSIALLLIGMLLAYLWAQRCQTRRLRRLRTRWARQEASEQCAAELAEMAARRVAERPRPCPAVKVITTRRGGLTVYWPVHLN